MPSLLNKVKINPKKISHDIKEEIKNIAKETGSSITKITNEIETEALKLRTEAKKALQGKLTPEGSTSKFVFVDAPESTSTRLSNFNPSPKNRYHAANNLILCEAARLAYKRWDRCESLLKKWGFDEVQTFSHPDGDFGYLAKTDGFIIVAFRGTNDPKNWITDLTVERMAFMGKKQWKVHKGIRNAFYRLWRTQGMMNALVKMRDNNQPIFICGHGLGGGIAVIAAAWIAMSADTTLNANDIGALVTIGQPRVMNAGLATALNRKTAFINRYFRYTNNQDPVPTVPIEQVLGKKLFKHGGTPLDFDGKSKLKISAQPENSLLANNDVGDHSSSQYAEHMLNNLQAAISRKLPYGK